MKIINYLNDTEIGFSIFDDNQLINGDRKNGFGGMFSVKEGVIIDKLEYEGLNDYQQKKLIKKQLPEFYQMCEGKEKEIIIDDIKPKDIILMYEAINYAIKKDKRIIIN